MFSQAGTVKSRLLFRLSTVCLLALGASACSSEAVRFTETPFDNPFRTAQASPMRDPVTTGSIGSGARAPLQPVPSAPVVRSQALPPPQSAVAMRPAPTPAPVQPVGGSAAGWSAQGGTPIVLAQGETLDMISSRYGVPRAALMSANGLSSANVAPGTRLTIPVYNAGGTAAVAAEPIRRAAPVAAEPRGFSPPPVRQAAADTRSQARSAAEARAKAEADAQAMRESRARFAAEAKAKAEARKLSAAPTTRPLAEAKSAAAAPVRPGRAPVEPSRPAAVASAPATPVAKVEPASLPDPKTTASLPKQESVASSSADKEDFRWPARGRVISGFSGKGGNEGINIAVPDGTPVKAAEEGTVAYAGSELKGYGNLVLIRHPNGYVSAYAHNGELKVKRGDVVRRGQVVASSGQSGNVSSPQLHFELRKGSTPVDPTPYLNN
ncbi:peptidoglycan DD-metalloendopeptidase family protein [Bosea sp. (in: a-proteobacteria)]